jgi:hypothetical protein
MWWRVRDEPFGSRSWRRESIGGKKVSRKSFYTKKVLLSIECLYDFIVMLHL